MEPRQRLMGATTPEDEFVKGWTYGPVVWPKTLSPEPYGLLILDPSRPVRYPIKPYKPNPKVLFLGFEGFRFMLEFEGRYCGY